MPQLRLEVADIFCAHGAAWRAANAGHVSRDQLKVMSAIERCRTAVLGGHVARCEDCAYEHIAYNSCRNRHCPKCQAGAAKTWLAAREAELLPVRYFHLVFTLPKQIADIASQNKREIYNLLMEPFAGPKAVLAYLSRYTHRVAISNSSLIRFDEHSVTFRVKNYRLKGADRHTTMTLATSEFIRRFLLHVLPKGQHRIRHYGFYGNGNRAANIARIRQLLGANPSDKDRADEDGHSVTNEPPRVLALPCPCCGGQLIITSTIAPVQHSRAPPTTARAAA